MAKDIDALEFLSRHGDTLRNALEEAVYESKSWLDEADDADWRNSEGLTREQHLANYARVADELEGILSSRRSELFFKEIKHG